MFGVKGPSPLAIVPKFDLVRGVAMDYMHCVLWALFVFYFVCGLIPVTIMSPGTLGDVSWRLMTSYVQFSLQMKCQELHGQFRRQ